MPKNYTLTPEKIKEFGMLYLLERMINKPMRFNVMLDNDDSHLEELLTILTARGYVEIDRRNRYSATRRGRDVIVQFMNRYTDFLKNFDCFCAVDLEEGEFAFEEFWEFEDEDEWCDYLDQERWEDLRIAVAEFKGLDPLEIVFMAMINEERINDKVDGWQFDLVLGTVWQEILEICNTALQVADLAYDDDEEGHISGEQVMAEILSQGGDLNIRLKKQEEEYGESEDKPSTLSTDGAVPYVQRPTITYTTYENYYKDPRYVSPVWRKRYWDWDWD